MKRIYTYYSDGQTWIDDRHGTNGTPINIPHWQWRLFCIYRWVDRKVGQWIKDLDNKAFEAGKRE